MMIKRVPVNRLKIGMYVYQPEGGEKLEGLESSGYIRRKSTISKIQKTGAKFVFIDTEKGAGFDEHSEPKTQPSIKNRQPSQKDKNEARKVYKESLLQINRVMGDAKLGNRIDISPVEEIAGKLCETLSKTPLALQWLTQMQGKNSFLFEHALNCGIIMGIFSRHLKLTKPETSKNILGAILHDIGKSALPDIVVEKNIAHLKNEDLQQYEGYFQAGLNYLKESHIDDPTIIEMCRDHQEVAGESKYVKHPSLNENSNNGQIMTIVNHYETLTSNRGFETECTPCIAMKKLKEIDNSIFNEDLVSQFQICFGIYPSGTLVELSNGRLAIVITPNTEIPEKPFIKIIYNKSSSSYETPYEIDLAKNVKGIVIIRSVHPKKYNIDIDNFL